MLLGRQQLNRLSEVALLAVIRAGQYIETFDRSKLQTYFKDNGSSLSSQVVTEVDLHCQTILIEQLQASCDSYDIALLSEENCLDIPIAEHARLTKDYFWCIDPLDGTLPFIEGRDGYALSVALVTKSGRPVLSAIYLPASQISQISQISYHTEIDHQGNTLIYKNKKHFIPTANDNQKTLSFYCDQSFINHNQYQLLINQLKELLIELGLEKLTIISGNGAVVNALSVFENAPAIYIKLPKQQQGGGALWDFSGTACIFNATGNWVSDISGSRLTLNQADSYYMNQRGVIYASNNTLAQQVIKLCQVL